MAGTPNMKGGPAAIRLSPSDGLPAAATCAKGQAVVRRRSLFVTLARYAGWAAIALLIVFFGLSALYTAFEPISTLMLARTIEGKSYERDAVRLRESPPRPSPR